jgi:hypothetical protein
MIDWKPLTKDELEKLFRNSYGNAQTGTGGGKLYSSYRKRGLSIEETKKKCNAKTFTITRDYIQEIWCNQKGKCDDSNVIMDTKYLWINQHSLAPSIDRIDNNEGYIVGNIRIVLRGFNKFRGTMKISEWNDFKKQVNFMVERE